jgi:ribosome-associated heat shock protein Hsp15
MEFYPSVRRPVGQVCIGAGIRFLELLSRIAGVFFVLAIESFSRIIIFDRNEEDIERTWFQCLHTMRAANSEKKRIDRWLWAVRQFKTRTQATEACRGGKIRVREEKVKPSYSIKIGELIEIQQGPITKRLEVLGLIEKRVGAKLVPDFMTDLTPPEDYELLRQTAAQAILRRDRGTGRPTKKERREIEELFWGE